jgi:hypothetical protein
MLFIVVLFMVHHSAWIFVFTTMPIQQWIVILVREELTNIHNIHGEQI